MDVYDYERATNLGQIAFKNKSYKNAFKHLEKASKLGNKVAQYTIALQYMGGYGVEKDYIKAYLWLNVASEAKVNKWRKLRDRVHNALSKQQQDELKPHLESYINKYGAKTQDVNCRKKSSTGSNIRVMTCIKSLDSGALRIN